jgi:putative intracellular protease/amidase
MKKTKVVLLGLSALALAGWGLSQVSPAPKGRSPNVMVLLGEWFGDAYFPLKKEIENRGWTMKRVGLDGEYRGCYNKKRDVVLRSDIVIQDQMDLSGYDALIIPSGPQWRKFRENPSVLQFVKKAHAAGLLIASFCVGNFTVRDAGLIDVPDGPAIFPQKVTLVKERILIGPRGGGPPPGDGFESAPIAEICDAVALAVAEIRKVGPGGPDREAEKREIAEVISSVIGWAKDKDLDRFFGSIANDEDYISVTPGERVIKRFEDVKQNVPFWMSPDFKYIRHDLKDLEITFARCGKVAWFYCVLDDINTYKGEPASWENARWTGVVEKRDGKWVVVSQHFSFAKVD